MSETRIELNSLPAQFEELVKLAASGHEIVVTDHDVPRAKLIILQQPKRRIAGLHPGSIQMSDDFDAPLPESFWTGE
jgi:antitoxin (DNA-binding transcriptional repressor) of toxin-antitoxin stability system